MNKHINPAISEEKFAAWLDGMLPADEMNRLGSLVESDSMLRHLQETNALVDDAIANFKDADFQMLPNIDASTFELPNVSKNNIFQLVNLSLEPMEDLPIAACANDDTAISGDNDLTSDDHIQTVQQESDLGMEQFDSTDDLPYSLTDEYNI